MRVTNGMRRKILSDIYMDRFQPSVDKEHEKLRDIAQRLANKWYPPFEKEYMAKAPGNGFFRALYDCQIVLLNWWQPNRTQSRIFRHELLNWQGEYEGSRSKRPNVHRAVKIQLREPIFLKMVDINLRELPADKKAERDLLAMQKRLDGIAERRNKVMELLRQALWACNTVKQLHDRYPSLKKYLPPDVKNDSREASKALAVQDKQIAEALK